MSNNPYIILIGSSAHRLENEISKALDSDPLVVCTESYAQGLTVASDQYPNVELVVISDATCNQDELYDLALNIHPAEIFVISELSKGVEQERRRVGDINIPYINSQLSVDEIVSIIRR